MLDSVQRVLHYAVPTDVKMHLQMVLLDSVQCVLHYAVPTDVRIHWRIVIRNIIVQLSTCCAVPTNARKNWQMVMLHCALIANSNGI